MQQAIIYQKEIEQIEKSLAETTNVEARLPFLDRLIEHCIYTNVKRAKVLLDEYWNALKYTNNEDFTIRYYLLLGAFENQLYNFQDASNSYSKALTLLETLGDVTQLTELYLDFVGVCINLDDIRQADIFLQKSFRFLELKPEPNLISRYKLLQGHSFLIKTYYDKAVELLLDAERIFVNLSINEKTLKDYYYLTHLYTGLGKVYEITEQPEKRIKISLQVANICENYGLTSRLSFYYNNVGSAYFNQRNLEKAEEYFWKAVKSSDDLSLSAKASSYANLGRCYFMKDMYENALEYYEVAQSYYEEKGEPEYSNLSVIDTFIGELYLEIEKPKKALKNMIKAYNKAEIVADYRQALSVCKRIAELYAEDNDFKNAYQYLKRYDEIHEKYNNQLNARKIKEIEIIYETEKIERESELLRLQSIQLQNKALRAQMNPHFMYNALNAIQHYIVNHDSDLAAQYLSKFSNLMRSSLDFSEAEVISLEDELAFLREYLDLNQKLRFENRMQYEIIVDEDIEDDIIGVPTMIIQPYVENAIEHGIRYKKGGTIKIEFTYYDDDTLLCIVQDDGVGREKARQLREEKSVVKQHKSRGTFITEDRLRLMHKTGIPEKDIIKIEDIKDADTAEVIGTKVSILIPIQNVF